MIKLEVFVFNPFQENTFLISDESGKCIVVDPGMYDPRENKKISEFIEARKLIPEAIVNTHCHVDHVLGCRSLHARGSTQSQGRPRCGHRTTARFARSEPGRDGEDVRSGRRRRSAGALLPA